MYDYVKFKFKFFIIPKNTSEATHFNNTLNQWEGKQKKLKKIHTKERTIYET